MTKQDFLNKLKEGKKLELVEPSNEICSSYLEKSENCFRSAKILFRNGLYENSVSMSYYGMYNSLTALLFKTGIKCENHNGSILVLKRLFGSTELFDIISFAKEERIDKQYYITSKQNLILTEESAKDMLDKCEKFTVQIKLLIENTRNEDIEKVRGDFAKI